MRRVTLRRVGLALLSSALYVASYPGARVDLGLLAFVAYVPLALAIRDLQPKKALALGWLAGAVTTIAGFRFLLPLLEQFSGFGAPVCVLLLIGLGGLHGARTGVHAWLATLAPRRFFWLAFVLGFAIAEAFVPAVFAWRFAATMHARTWLWQSLDLVGAIGLGTIVVAFNVGLAELALARIERRPIDRRVVVAAVALPLLASIYGAVRLRDVEARIAAAPRTKVGLVQGSVPLLLDEAEAARSIVRQRGIADDLAARGAELLVWSEATLPFALIEGSEEVGLRYYLGPDAFPTPTLVGVVERSPTSKHETNTALLVHRGRVLGRYDKQDLLAFSEFLPLGETFPVLYDLSPASAHFVPGPHDGALPWGDHTLGVAICYEDVVAARVRGLVTHAPVDLLVNMTNDAWFGDGDEPVAHLVLASMRSVEERRTLVRATNTGVTAMVDPTGAVVARAPTSQSTGLLVEAPLLRVRTVYAAVGDAVAWLALFAFAGLLAVSRAHTRDSNVAGPSDKLANSAGADDVSAGASAAGTEPARTDSESAGNKGSGGIE